eukprot:TRINITY_DN17496_c0_g2_i2.p1 TRINITY_DN17496_c0_g2~~TRINITY_DN17496_c0_g2_i2.p1  ORF type:complete len:247 (-),score=21.77 TRINITY_DN17496_c0_g2_i2:121-861(-)
MSLRPLSSRAPSARVRFEIGSQLLQSGHLVEAEHHLVESWRQQRALHGDNAMSSARAAAAALSVNRMNVKTLGGQDAISILQHAQRVALAHLEPLDGERLLFRSKLGLLLEAAGRYEEASHEFRALLEGWRPGVSLDPSDFDRRLLLEALSAATGEAFGGKPGFELLSLTAGSAHASDTSVAPWRHKLGLALIAQGRLDEAEAQLSRLQQTMRVGAVGWPGALDLEADLAAIRRTRHYKAVVARRV